MRHFIFLVVSLITGFFTVKELFFEKTTETVTRTTLEYVGPGSGFFEPWMMNIPPLIVFAIIVLGIYSGAFPRPPRR